MKEMAKYCPHTNSKVVYLVCQECDDRVCEKKKNETKEVQVCNCEGCICDTCMNKKSESNQMFFGRMVRIVRCKIFHSTLFNALKLHTECDYYNVDVSQMEICLNCEHYLGGGDWGLSCAKEYHRLVGPTDEACGDFSFKKN